MRMVHVVVWLVEAVVWVVEVVVLVVQPRVDVVRAGHVRVLHPGEELVGLREGLAEAVSVPHERASSGSHVVAGRSPLWC